MSFGEDVDDLVEGSQDHLIGKATRWPRVRLGEVAVILNGFPWKSERFNKSTGVPLIRIRDVTTGQTETFYNGPITEGYWIDPGDLLVGMDGDFNVRRWSAERGLLNQRVCKIVAHPDQYDTYLLEYLLPGYLRLINQVTSSVTVKHLSSRTLAELPLPLPPIAEQRRIVARLDALTARIARARAELDRVPVLAAHFRRMALVACFSSVPNAPIELGTLLRAIEAGKNLRCEERIPREGENGVVKVSAVTWGRFDATQSKTLPSDYEAPEKSRIRKGDLLISRANTLELVGAVVLVENQPRDLFLSDKILRLAADDADKKWILWFLRSPDGRNQIEALATGNQLSMRNISQEALRQIKLPIPDVATRTQRVRMLETAFARADRLEAEAARARALLDRLESAILAKAFRGELVPQDDNDEPASVLLERIRAQRAVAPKKTRVARHSRASG